MFYSTSSNIKERNELFLVLVQGYTTSASGFCACSPLELVPTGPHRACFLLWLVRSWSAQYVAISPLCRFSLVPILPFPHVCPLWGTCQHPTTLHPTVVCLPHQYQIEKGKTFFSTLVLASRKFWTHVSSWLFVQPLNKWPWKFAPKSRSLK